jgi:hypothetical protein
MNNNRVEIITDIITGKQTIRTIVDDNESNERKFYFELSKMMLCFFF